MKNRFSTVLYFLVVPVLLLLVWEGCKSEVKKEVPGSTAPATDSLPGFALKKQAIHRHLDLPAELLPYEKAEIFGKVQGYIRQINVDIGDQVKKGQLLVLIDAPEMVASLQQAQAKLEELRAKYGSSLDYYQRLHKASQVQGTISASELSQAYHAMQADSAAVQTAKASINTYSQLNTYLSISSPFSGIVTQRQADVGSLVSANSTRPVLTIENNHKLRLRVAIPEVYSTGIPKSKDIKFSTPAEPTKIYSAVFSRQSGNIDPTTRTETWEFLYDNPALNLKSGMFVKASLDLGRAEASFAVPQSAIVSNLEKKFVIAQREGKAVQVPIRTGFTMQDATEIFGDLQEGDVLLLKPNDEIKPGQSINVKIKML